MKLLFSRNPNPRLAVAVARHLNVALEFEHASPFAPGQAERYRPLNPNLSLPILVEDSGKTLWEADAIACRLSRHMRSQFWRSDDNEPDMIRWISWGKANFMHACDMVHFELGTKQRYKLGPIDASLVEEGTRRFRTSAAILDEALAGRTWLLGNDISYADFRMAAFLPYNDVAGLPLADFREVTRWNAQLETLDAWSDPFRGLDAPELPRLR